MQQESEEYVRELREDHARFSRVMLMIGRDARRLVDEPEAVLPLFAEAVDYVVSFQNVYHHPRIGNACRSCRHTFARTPCDGQSR